MISKSFAEHIGAQLGTIRSAGTYKNERVIATPQGTMIRVADGQPVLNLCANNYLGLAQDPRVLAAAKEALARWGYGLSSVRFICGTQDVHKQLEARLSAFLGIDDTILYSSCFDANGGLFETLLDEQDPIGIVQALQEQHFQWQEKVSRTVIEDTRLAYRAIAGGDALITALAQVSDGNLAALGHLAAARRVSLQMDRLTRDLPRFLRSQLILPFREGSDFVAWGIKAKGQGGLTALYANPPYATAQILHPERYYLTMQTPHQFFPAGLLRHMEMPALFEQSLGEYLLRDLLETGNSPAASSQIAAGWRGDQLFSYTDNGFQTTAWYSAWGAVPEAAGFQLAFQRVAETRQHIRLRRGAGSRRATRPLASGQRVLAPRPCDFSRPA